MGKKLGKLNQTCRVVRRFGNGKKHSTPVVTSNGDKTTGSRSRKFNRKERKKSG